MSGIITNFQMVAPDTIINQHLKGLLRPFHTSRVRSVRHPFGGGGVISKNTTTPHATHASGEKGPSHELGTETHESYRERSQYIQRPRVKGSYLHRAGIHHTKRRTRGYRLTVYPAGLTPCSHCCTLAVDYPYNKKSLYNTTGFILAGMAATKG